jgi:large subunit ribosomal protein L28
MAICSVCGKKTTTGNLVSHSNIKSKRTWSPNLQRVKIILNGSPQKVYVCTRCLRSGKVQRAV